MHLAGQLEAPARRTGDKSCGINGSLNKNLRHQQNSWHQSYCYRRPLTTRSLSKCHRWLQRHGQHPNGFIQLCLALWWKLQARPPFIAHEAMELRASCLLDNSKRSWRQRTGSGNYDPSTSNARFCAPNFLISCCCVVTTISDLPTADV